MIVSRVNFSQAYDMLQAIGGKKDLRPWFKSYLVPTIAEWIKYQYATKGSALGTPWAPIRGNVKKRVGVWGANYPMVDTGKSMRALTARGGGDTVREFSPYTMVYGTTLDYMDYHHRPQGFTVTHVYGRALKTPVHVPARFVLPPEWPQKVTSLWEESLIRYIESVVERSMTSSRFSR